jgi:hypothetical protein
LINFSSLSFNLSSLIIFNLKQPSPAFVVAISFLKDTNY